MPNIQLNRTQKNVPQDSEEKSPFLLAYRTAFYNDLCDRLKKEKYNEKDRYVLPPQNIAIGETFFVFNDLKCSQASLTVRHDKGNTILFPSDDIKSSKYLLSSALKVLMETNNRSIGDYNKRQSELYDLSFKIHIEAESQLEGMLRIAMNAGVPISGCLINGHEINPIDVEAMRDFIRNNPEDNQAEESAQSNLASPKPSRSSETVIEELDEDGNPIGRLKQISYKKPGEDDPLSDWFSRQRP